MTNAPLRTPPSPFIQTMRVRCGFDVADREIVEQVQAGDRPYGRANDRQFRALVLWLLLASGIVLMVSNPTLAR